MTTKLTGHAAISGVSSRVLGALVLVAAFGLAGCSDVDTMLFGDSGPEAESTGPVASAPQAPATATAPVGAPATPAAAPEAAAAGIGPVAPITPVTIEAGAATGTNVNRTVIALRTQLSGLQDTLRTNAQRYTELRQSSANSAYSYYEARAHITSRLQMGTTRGNPELVAEWNRAQTALDQLSTNINNLNALGAAVAGDANTAHSALDQIGVTFNVAGAVDDDHRQLSVLQDEANQSIIQIDRLLGQVSADIQRQTAYVANERANLTTLAAAIKNGELYGADLSAPMFSAGRGVAPRAAIGIGAPLVVIRFDRPNVDYQQILYAALTQALQSRPGAAFAIVAVSPTRGNVTAVQLAQTAAQRHAQEVLRSMTDMGVPATRLAVTSQTDPGITVNEVRVFLR